MRVAAGMLGLIAGVGQFLISLAVWIAVDYRGWVLPALILIGLIAGVGGFLAWSQPKVTGVLLLGAGLVDVAVALASTHYSALRLILLVPPVLLLVLGGTLALAARREAS